jgi:hypothetical protein
MQDFLSCGPIAKFDYVMLNWTTCCKVLVDIGFTIWNKNKNSILFGYQNESSRLLLMPMKQLFRK